MAAASADLVEAVVAAEALEDSAAAAAAGAAPREVGNLSWVLRGFYRVRQGSTRFVRGATGAARAMIAEYGLAP